MGGWLRYFVTFTANVRPQSATVVTHTYTANTYTAIILSSEMDNRSMSFGDVADAPYDNFRGLRCVVY